MSLKLTQAKWVQMGPKRGFFMYYQNQKSVQEISPVFCMKLQQQKDLKSMKMIFLRTTLFRNF